MKKMIEALFQWPVIIVACLTIGLAPFLPEPHIWGKIKWVVGGGNEMQFMDIFDLAMHGLPWVLLILKAVSSLVGRKS